MPSTSYVDASMGVRAIGDRTDSSGVDVTDVSSSEDRIINGVLTEGFLTSDAFVVNADSPESMDVVVGSGTAMADVYVVAGDDDGQHNYLVRLDSAGVTVSLDAADASNSRTDEVWLVVADNAYDSGGVSLPRIGLRKGDAGSGAPGPDASWTAAVKLASVAVGTGVAEITAGNITDERAATGLNQILRGEATFTGLVTFEDGIQGSLGFDVQAHGLSQSSWPDGLTWQTVGSGSGNWPSTTGSAYMFNLGNSPRTWQLFADTTSDMRLWFRRWSGSGWTSWQTLTTAQNPGAWEVDNSTEVASASASTTSFETVASVTLDIPSDWGSWKCEAYATWTGDSLDGGYTRISIDGAAQQQQIIPEGSNGAVGGRRTGMTTTGSRTVALQARDDSGTSTYNMPNIYLYARAVRTS